ncbi:nucleotidyltransferase domain-containing protein [Sphingomonas olei]|jgi:predicted nucleotidyltransferase|uniref:Nucleotidyltransferase domain-containing protein n=1 Tax=Sphingomonas olei TaxID=1886787 RepID=A0ABY2QDM2_9SPHN|nr:nucleotidyltransferase domain-containing protein [Sphingomonas olei]THG36902.1 nucleotidyltransferase domain-containing protein [Sphingomonas olei]
MRTDLDHLTVAKRQELARVVSILFDEFERARAGKNAPAAKSGRILKVVLFGSYARGDWVADPQGGYFSDFDILVVLNNDELTNMGEYWQGAEDHLLRDLEAGGPVRTSVNLIVHTLADVNARLKRGRHSSLTSSATASPCTTRLTIRSILPSRCRAKRLKSRRKAISMSGSQAPSAGSNWQAMQRGSATPRRQRSTFTMRLSACTTARRSS